nr:hypothetical protein [uncultured Cohaesibacter sp.]
MKPTHKMIDCYSKAAPLGALIIDMKPDDKFNPAWLEPVTAFIDAKLRRLGAPEDGKSIGVNIALKDDGEFTISARGMGLLKMNVKDSVFFVPLHAPADGGSLSKAVLPHIMTPISGGEETGAEPKAGSDCDGSHHAKIEGDAAPANSQSRKLFDINGTEVDPEGFYTSDVDLAELIETCLDTNRVRNPATRKLLNRTLDRLSLPAYADHANPIPNFKPKCGAWHSAEDAVRAEMAKLLDAYRK